MEDFFFNQGLMGVLALSASFIIVRMWQFYAQRRDYKQGESTRLALIDIIKEQNDLQKEAITILRAHDERAIDTQRRIIEMSAEGGTIDKLLDIIKESKNQHSGINYAVQRPYNAPTNNPIAPKVQA